MDDYLVTPSIQLQKNVQYRFTFDANEVGLTHEYLNVLLGQGTTVDALKTTLAKYDFDWRNDNSGQIIDFSVEEDGLYNIAFHDCAPEYSSNYALDNIGIAVYAFFEGPAASTNIKATPGAGGALHSTLTFTLPTTTFKGDALNEITSVEVRRNGKVIATLEGKPGEAPSPTKMTLLRMARLLTPSSATTLQAKALLPKLPSGLALISLLLLPS